MISQSVIENTEQVDTADWIGRSETRDGQLSPDIAGMLGAATGHPAAGATDFGAGMPMPWLWHWAAFPEFVPMEALGEDGHPRLGGLLPPVPYPRRMWAGSKLAFEGRFAIGERLQRRSEILSIDEKQGATGPMVFVRVGHEITGRGGRVEERQDIVYLKIPDRFRPPAPVPAPEAPIFVEPVVMSEARLFRFSAATFNAHRIHYDLPYAREVEKYPALVVHGPLQAMLLIEAAARHTGQTPSRFSFRGIHPMFHGEALSLMGTPGAGGTSIDLCTVAAAGHQGLQATMEWNG